MVPAFSHDGKRIAYVHMMTGPQGGTGPLMVVNADGSDAHQIGNIVAGALQFSWSPDDKSLVYSGLPNGLWTVGVDGSRAKRIFVDGGDASWSADDRIVIARPAHGLTTMSSDGSDIRRLPRPKAPKGDAAGQLFQPSVVARRQADRVRAQSLASQQEVPLSDHDRDRRRQGGRPQVVTKVFDSTGTALSWSPDGTSFAFTDLREDVPGLWMIPSTGGQAKALIDDDATYGLPSWGPAGT